MVESYIGYRTAADFFDNVGVNDGSLTQDMEAIAYGCRRSNFTLRDCVETQKGAVSGARSTIGAYPVVTFLCGTANPRRVVRITVCRSSVKIVASGLVQYVGSVDADSVRLDG
jgi:hypothetical protein